MPPLDTANPARAQLLVSAPRARPAGRRSSGRCSSFVARRRDGARSTRTRRPRTEHATTCRGSIDRVLRARQRSRPADRRRRLTACGRPLLPRPAARPPSMSAASSGTRVRVPLRRWPLPSPSSSRSSRWTSARRAWAWSGRARVGDRPRPRGSLRAPRCSRRGSTTPRRRAPRPPRSSRRCRHLDPRRAPSAPAVPRPLRLRPTLPYEPSRRRRGVVASRKMSRARCSVACPRTARPWLALRRVFVSPPRITPRRRRPRAPCWPGRVRSRSFV